MSVPPTLAPKKALAPGACDFVMANPPFNVDLVDAERIKNDPRLPFGLPGVNKDKRVSNGNYLWISYFYSYLSEKGRAGFVMSSQASSAGNDEKTVRQKLVETGAVDVMISIKGGFFYPKPTHWYFQAVSCELIGSGQAMLFTLSRAAPRGCRVCQSMGTAGTGHSGELLPTQATRAVAREPQVGRNRIEP